MTERTHCCGYLLHYLILTELPSRVAICHWDRTDEGRLVNECPCCSALLPTWIFPPFVTSLPPLRKRHGLTKIETAERLGLSVDVWQKFEQGIIQSESLERHQLARLARFFLVSEDRFRSLLNASREDSVASCHRRSVSPHPIQMAQRQSFATALARSTMGSEAKKRWFHTMESPAGS